MNIIKQSWKVLGVLLVLYSLVAGLGIPLKVGIEEVSNVVATSGQEIEVEVKGYNAHYTQAKDVKAWLKLDTLHYIPASDIKVKDDIHLNASFLIPSSPPYKNANRDLTLVVSNEIDGYSLLPSAITYEPIAMDTLIGKWENSTEGVHIVENFAFPYRVILYESIRNLFYHVPLWFGMFIIFFTSAFYSIFYLRNKNPLYEVRAYALNQVGILYGILGLLTGAIWANWTWGEPWSGDVKQNMSAIVMLIYLAYLALRSSFDDRDKRARISSIYNIFACVSIVPLLFVIPRLYDSLHPGNGGNPGFGGDDLDHTMKLIFYPAVIGWTLIGFWVASLAYRYIKINQIWLEKE